MLNTNQDCNIYLMQPTRQPENVSEQQMECFTTDSCTGFWRIIMI